MNYKMLLKVLRRSKIGAKSFTLILKGTCNALYNPENAINVSEMISLLCES